MESADDFSESTHPDRGTQTRKRSESLCSCCAEASRAAVCAFYRIKEQRCRRNGAHATVRCARGFKESWSTRLRCCEVGSTSSRTEAIVCGRHKKKALHNLRGGYSKGMYEGGEQERKLAATFNRYADMCASWPRTSAVLRE